jgi:ADP-ribose pyrophosphatase YjhB (NUDIX family)
MITYEKGDIKFNFRVSAVIYNSEKTKVLVLQTPGCEFCALPGGRVEELESSKDAIIREMKEEMSINIEVQLTKMYEMFFLLSSKRYHELTYYYVVTKLDDISIYEKSEFPGNEKKDWFKWVDLADLPNVDFRPAAMKKTIIEKDCKLEHVILNEL